MVRSGGSCRTPNNKLRVCHYSVICHISCNRLQDTAVLVGPTHLEKVALRLIEEEKEETFDAAVESPLVKNIVCSTGPARPAYSRQSFGLTLFWRSALMGQISGVKPRAHMLSG